ncbi:MAG: hypothetical protein C5B49_05985 [Bdellovibrio sp.]|nr:MAG: hypothetical protein C5B49_05985 [Bdellovibrio sp.]
MREQEMLNEVLEHHGADVFTFETTASFGQDVTFWTLQNWAALVLVLPDDEVLLPHFLQKLKNTVPRSLNLLLVAPTLTPQLMQTTSLFTRMRVVKSPVDGFSLYRNLIDLTTVYPAGMIQTQPRYLTDQQILVVSDFKNKESPGQMRNLSTGGIYFEISELVPSFLPGDLIRIMVDLQGLNSYQFDAKVIWSKPLANADVTGYGCAFLNNEQVYDTILARVSSTNK